MFIVIIIIIISTFITVSAGVLYVRQPGANHAPRTSVTQVNLSVQILSTFLRICADPIIIIIIVVIIIIMFIWLWKITTGQKLEPSRLKILKNLFKTFWKL